MRSIQVKEVYQLHGMASAIVDREELFEDVVSRFAHEPELRGIFLVDSEGRFAGLITRIAIMKWAQFQLIRETKRDISVREVLDIVATTKAKHLARGDWKSLGVKENDSLQTAFDQMVRMGEDVLPVLGSDGKILGDIRLSEVLLKAIQIGKSAQK